MTAAVALAEAHRVSDAPSLVGYVALVVVLAGFASLTLWLAVSSLRHRRIGGDDPHDGDGRSGGGWGRGPDPPDRSPDTGPEWWPEFERQFAAHVDSRANERNRAVLTRSGY